MIYRQLGKSDMNISVVGMGTWGLGNDYSVETDEKTAVSAIHAGLDSGINFVDTAPNYGLERHSEVVVGKALKGRRDKVFLATKCGYVRYLGEQVRTLDPLVLRHEIELSLKALQTDYLDLYQLHWPDYSFGNEAALDFIADLKKQGKVRYTGVSNFNPEQIQVAIDRADIVSNQPPLSMIRRDVLKEIVPFCITKNVGTLSYGPLDGGILTGRVNLSDVDHFDIRSWFYGYTPERVEQVKKLLVVLEEIANARGITVAQVSIAWNFAQPGVTSALVGASRATQAEANAAAGDVELTAEELKKIDDTYDKIF